MPDINTKSKPTNNLPPHQHRSKSRPTQDRDQSQNKSNVSSVANLIESHSHKSRPKPNSHSSSRKLGESAKAKHTSQFEQIPGSKSNHSSNHKTRPIVQHSTQHSPTRTKHSVPTGRETNGGLSCHSQSTTKAVSNTGSNSRSDPSPKARAKSWERKASTLLDVNHCETSQRKLQSKERASDQRETHLTQAEGRKHGRKEDRHRETQKERKEDRRLAEEQLLRRPWIQSSAEEEEEEEEEGAIERQRRRERTEKEESRRSRQHQHRHKWQNTKAKPKLPTSIERQRLQDNSYPQSQTKKGGRSEDERESQLDPPPSRTPTPRLPSSSSNSDSESESAQITKVPADSTSLKRLSKRGHQGLRLDASKPKVLNPQVPTSGNPTDRLQSGGRQKLYTLVPFGRSDQATGVSQRGLRNLVVQIDLSLLKRVPDSTINSTVKNLSSTSSSSTTKDKQREAMKHLYMPDTVTKDGKRKRKVGNIMIYLYSLSNVYL